MFQNPKYLTCGAQRTLPGWLVLLLWHLIERSRTSNATICKCSG